MSDITTPYLGCNASLDEIMRYGSVEQIQQNLAAYATELAVKKGELAEAERYIERVEEQVYFAKDLIENIQIACRENTRAKDLKKAINVAIENSSFET